MSRRRRQQHVDLRALPLHELRARLAEVLVGVEEHNFEPLHAGRVVAMLATLPAERFGGPRYITAHDVEVILRDWRDADELRGNTSPRSLGFWEASLLRLCGLPDGESAVRAGKVSPPPDVPERLRANTWTPPDVAAYIHDLIALISLRERGAPTIH